MERKEEFNEGLPGFLPEKKRMKAPDGYFEAFPDRVLNRWRKEGSQPVAKKIIWWKVAAIAAVLTGLCIGGWWLNPSDTSGEISGISSVEAYQYVHENIAEFEGLMETEDIGVVQNQIDVPEEAIDEYLIEELDGNDPVELF